mgnify:FL=1
MTTFAEIYDCCMALKGTEETFPFDEETLVFKVAGKMFALCGVDTNPPRVNVKCDPERAITLREEHDAITPGYHMNKKHWNTLICDGRLEAGFVAELIQDSYELVVAGLTRKARAELEEREEGGEES